MNAAERPLDLGRGACPPVELSALDIALIDRFQSGLPLTARPFADMGRAVGAAEEAVLDALGGLVERGIVARVGPIFAPNAFGASTLAAMAVPAHRLDAVAAEVSAYPEVNHNYERGHELNLWFVVTAAERERVTAVLSEISAKTGLAVLDLPLIEAFHIDLGFSPWREPGDACRDRTARRASGAVPRVGPAECRLAAALEDGLALEPSPFDRVADRLGWDTAEVCQALASLNASGAIKRFGLIVRHHELGFRANAMVVLDVPDARIDGVGRDLASRECVTLCYQRPRRLPVWPYNLFCMIHGRDRDRVEAEARRLGARAGVAPEDFAVLFSTRRFKQRGARYGARAEQAAPVTAA